MSVTARLKRLGFRYFLAGLIPFGVLCLVHAPQAHAQSNAAELIMFDSPNCVWCRRWDRDVGVEYDNSPEGRFAPLRRVQLSRGLPNGIRFDRPIRGTPTFVLVDRDQEVGRIIGYPGADIFWTQLGRLLDRVDPDWQGAVDPVAPPATVPIAHHGIDALHCN